MNALAMFFSHPVYGFFSTKWTEIIREEVKKNYNKPKRREKNPWSDTKIEGLLTEMERTMDYPIVGSFEDRDDINGVDKKDQHVAKSAIYNECNFLVTYNIKDFIEGKEHLKAAGVVLASPDSLLCAAWKKDYEQAFSLLCMCYFHKKSEYSFYEYLDFLKDPSKTKLPNFIKNVQKYLEENKDDNDSIESLLINSVKDKNWWYGENQGEKMKIPQRN